MSAAGQNISDIYNVLQYVKDVKDPYTLMAYIFAVFTISTVLFIKVKPVYKFAAITFITLTLVMAGFVFQGALSEAKERTVIQLTKGEGKINMTQDVAVALGSIKTLKKNRNSNNELSNAEAVIDKVLKEADVNHNGMKITEMSQQQWSRFLNDLNDIKRAKVLNIPFVQFDVYDKNGKNDELSGKYYFRNDTVELPDGDGPPIRFDLLNIYDAREGSGEKEAIYIRLAGNGGNKK